MTDDTVNRIGARFGSIERFAPPGTEAILEPVQRSLAGLGGFFKRSRPRGRNPIEVPAIGVGAIALGAVAVGAVAIGTLAIARLVIGRLAVRRMQIRDLDIENLTVHHMHVVEDIPFRPDDPGTQGTATEADVWDPS